MRKIRYLTIILTLVSLGLLLNIGIFSISAGEIKVTNALGLHTFNMSDPGNIIISKGSIIIINTNIEEEAEITITVDNALHPIDYDENGTVRTHKPTGNIIMYPLPNISWIVPEDNIVIVPANSVYELNYTIRAPAGDVWEKLERNVSRGFLGYINIRGGPSGTFGINYNHKLFMLFEGEYIEEKAFTSSILILYIGLGLISFGIIYVLIKYKIKQKKKIPIFVTTQDTKTTFKKEETPVFHTKEFLSNIELDKTLTELGEHEKR